MNQKHTLTHQQMAVDYEKMKQEEAELSAKLQERMSVHQKSSISLINEPKLLLTPKRIKEISNYQSWGQQSGRSPTKGDKNLLNKARKVVSRVGEKLEIEKVDESYRIDRGNLKEFVMDVFEQLPYAIPTLQLHIIISLTMVLMTHRCPYYFVAV